MLTLSPIHTHFDTWKKKGLGKRLWKKVKLLKMSNFTFSTMFSNVFYAICILKSCNSQISVVVCSFFEFGAVSKWWIRAWVNTLKEQNHSLCAWMHSYFRTPGSVVFDVDCVMICLISKISCPRFLLKFHCSSWWYRQNWDHMIFRFKIKLLYARCGTFLYS